MVITLRGIDLDDAAQSIAHDQVTIDAMAGNDRIIAGFIPNSTEITANQILTARAVDNLTLIAGPGDDRIVGTPYADTIDSGEGDETVTGHASVDTFVDSSGTDTLIEARDLNFILTDSQLTITGQQQSPVDPSALESVEEVEEVSLFERFELFGGGHENSFSVDQSRDRMSMFSSSISARALVSLTSSGKACQPIQPRRLRAPGSGVPRIGDPGPATHSPASTGCAAGPG